jgi:hypothetical protein
VSGSATARSSLGYIYAPGSEARGNEEHLSLRIGDETSDELTPLLGDP